MKAEFTITSEYAGSRLDLILGDLVEDFSRSRIQKMFPLGKIKVNGQVCDSKKYTAKEGDLVEVEIDDGARDKTPLAEDIPLDIYYESKDYLVINKPKGLVVHPANGNETGTLVNGLINYLGNDFVSSMKDICDIERPGIVHRIDKDTTGLLVVAKTPEAFRDLSAQFMNHTITRKYTALVYNNLKEDEGRIDFPIGRDPINRLRRAVNGIDSKHAVTNYRVIERLGNFNLVEASLETGRTHQIRVHMAFIGHPVVGDPIYGPRKDLLKADGQMLHAGLLGFTTVQGEYLEFKCDPPKHFQAVLAKINKLHTG